MRASLQPVTMAVVVLLNFYFSFSSGHNVISLSLSLSLSLARYKARRKAQPPHHNVKLASHITRLLIEINFQDEITLTLQRASIINYSPSRWLSLSLAAC